MDTETPAEKSVAGPKKKSWKGFWFYAAFALPAVGLLAAIAIPNFGKSRLTECKHACVNNLRQLDGAKEQWALEQKKTAGTVVTAVDEKEILKFMNGGEMPKCPDGGTLRINNVDAIPTCSFAGHSL